MNPPRAFNLADPEERARLLRETEGFARVSRNDGTDRAGRAFALDALSEAIAAGYRLAPPAPPLAPEEPLQWWWSENEESYFPAGSREEAIAEAVASIEEPGSTFQICRARRGVLRNNFFSAERLLEEFEDHNDELWGPDGPDAKVPPAAGAELERMLSEAFAAWHAKHRPYRAWSLVDMQDEEELVTPGAEEADAP